LAGWEGAIDPHEFVLSDCYTKLVSESGFVELVGIPFRAWKNSRLRNSTVGTIHGNDKDFIPVLCGVVEGRELNL
jgi:hypothetical protein